MPVEKRTASGHWGKRNLMIMLASTTSSQQMGGTDSQGTNREQQRNGDSPDKEEIFEVLSNERRRHVLGYLQQHENGSAELSELVTQVTALENDVPPEQVRSDERKSVYVGLRQTHLPKMDEYNIVEYDRDRGTVELTGAAEQARMYLEFVPEDDIPWAYHYAGLSVILALITGLAWAGIPPVSGLDGMAIAFITVSVLAVSALVHTLYTRRHRLDRAYDFETGG